MKEQNGVNAWNLSNDDKFVYVCVCVNIMMINDILYS